MSDQQFPAQHQAGQPGKRDQMHPKPETDRPDYQPSGKLDGKVILITGGDSGIGRAVSILFAKEGAKLPIVYLDEQDDANDTKAKVESYGGECATFGEEKVQEFGGDQPLGRAGQPVDVAPSYLFLASDDAGYMSGQVLHPNGGEVVNT